MVWLLSLVGLVACNPSPCADGTSEADDGTCVPDTDDTGNATDTGETDPDGWVQIDHEGTRFCGVTRRGTGWCWADAPPQIDDLGNSNIVLEPVVAVGPWTRIALARGNGQVCAIHQDQSLWCWGDLTGGGPEPHQVDDGVWTALDGGPRNFCGIRGGETLCWGLDVVGRDDDEPENLPGAITEAGPWAALSSGGNGDGFNCAVKEDSTLWCWGSSNSGALGLGDVSSASSPTKVRLPDGWRSVQVGDFSTCGVRTDGRLRCWGEYRSGSQTGSPVQIQPADTFRSVDSTAYRVCAIRDEDGTVWCLISENDEFSQDQGVGPGWQSVVLGDNASCAVHTDGTAGCWIGTGGAIAVDVPE